MKIVVGDNINYRKKSMTLKAIAEDKKTANKVDFKNKKNTPVKQ